MTAFERWRNPGTDTYNGVKMLAELTGLSEAEVEWTGNRTRELLKAGHSKEQVKAALREESKTRPWEKAR